MEKLPQYEIDITLQEIEKGDGYLEYHKCGYPIFWSYNIIPDNGEFEKEWFEAVDIVVGSSNLWDSIESCPCCGEKLDLRIYGDYLDSDGMRKMRSWGFPKWSNFPRHEQDVSELAKKYCLEGDFIEFKVLIEEIGIKLGII